MCDETRFGYSMLFFIAFAKISFFSELKITSFILVVVLLQELTLFFLQITQFCCVYGFSAMSSLFKDILEI